MGFHWDFNGDKIFPIRNGDVGISMVITWKRWCQQQDLVIVGDFFWAKHGDWRFSLMNWSSWRLSSKESKVGISAGKNQKPRGVLVGANVFFFRKIRFDFASKRWDHSLRVEPRKIRKWCSRSALITAGWWWLEPRNFMNFHSVGKNHPIWLIFFRGVGWNHQPDIYIYIPSGNLT